MGYRPTSDTPGFDVPPALRSLSISQRLLGTEEIAVIHHTDCRLLAFSDRDLRQKVKDDLGSGTGSSISSPSRTSTRACGRTWSSCRATQLLNPETAIREFVYGVRTGRLREVPIEAARPA